MAHRVAVTAALAAIGIFGYFSILGLIQRNGWADMFAEAIAQEKVKLSDMNESSKTGFIGIAPLDFFLDQLIRFFYPCVSGERPELSLFAAYFAGQVLPLHTAVVLEGLRKGNKGTIISFSTCWGLAYQSIPVGIMMAVYCATHLWTSPLAADSLTPSAKADLLSIDAIQLRSITGAMTLGYIIPTILLALPALSWISPHRQQILLALWQFFPLWVSLWQFTLGGLVRFLGLVPASAQTTPESRLQYGMRAYRSILDITSVLHMVALMYVMFPYFRTYVFGVEDPKPVHARGVFVPMSVFAPHQVESIAEGSQTLLQYDMYCSLGAALVWAVYLSCESAGKSMAGAARSAFVLTTRILVVGPGGAVLWALRDRDEDALDEVSVKAKAPSFRLESRR